MKTTKIAALLAAGLMAASGATMAAAPDEGFVLGASAGSSQWRDSDVTGAQVDNRDTGFKAYAGYYFNSNVGVEVGYVNLGKANVSGAGATLDFKGSGVFADIVGHLPLTKEFSLLGRLGLFNGRVKVDGRGLGSDSDSGTDTKVGVGAQYMITPQVGLR
ncbi:MAG TPA: outer membrane beta-barrel protein, partial [Burkholderiaceae bacterium]|nr:outer membrane beta-barrel protein [Burkholderiaceae bacterium]